MQRRGWMRIVEASISVIIILGVLFFLYTKNVQTEELAIDERARGILTELSSDPRFRDAALSNRIDLITQSVALKIPESHLAFEVRLCELDDVCGKKNYTETNVYAAERVISSSLEKSPSGGGALPKKIRLFIWRRSLN